MRRKGFTVVELAIVSGIIVAITAITFANFPKFNRTLILSREINKLALVLRKSQSYALAVREFNSTYADDPFCTTPPIRFPPYGVSFSMTAGSSPDLRNNKTYIIFGDVNCTSLSASPFGYNSAGIDERVETFSMSAETQIQSIFGYGTACPSGCSLSHADAVYQRPAPTVVLIGENSGTYVTFNDRLEITLQIPNQNLSKKVVLRTSGQVSIE